MARSLAVLLGRSHDVLFNRTIEQLETATGHRGIDVRLMGDLLETAHRIIKKNGLDSSDSTALEVYASLRANVKKLAANAQLDYIGVTVRGNVISFNKKDIVADIEADSSFDQRSLHAMQAALLAELKHRYSKVSDGKNLVVNRLLNSL